MSNVNGISTALVSIHPKLVSPGGPDGILELQRQNTLLKTGALQDAIFNSANFSSIATDAKGVIQIFNVGAERMLGYTAAEVTNKITPADISDPQEVIARAEALSLEFGTPIRPGFEALVFKASRGIEDIYELTKIRKDGSRFPAVVSVTALRDAQESIIGYLLIGTDNAAGKQAEEALLKAGALQNAIFNSTNFSSIATDAKGVIQIFNVGAERMLGYTAAEVTNKITPADISDPQEVIARAEALSLELGTPIRPGFEALVFKASRGIEDIYELTYLRKDGSHFPAIVSVTALRDAHESIIGYLLIGTDNTARKLAEEERKRQAAEQQAAELKHANEALERSNIELQRFAYIASHDLQTPMRSIASFIELLQSTYADSLDEQANDWIRRTSQSIQHLQTLVRDLLEYSRVDAQPHPFQRVSIREVFDHAVSLLDASVRESRAEVTCGELPVVLGERAQLVQLMLNLIANALKYRGKETPRVRISAERKGDEWIFAIRDNGIGIAPKHHEKVFEIFQRLHDQKEYPGTGIGLAVCRRVVHRHGGRIWVESEPGRGSVFYFTIAEGAENSP